jgi:hypothetical protein
MLDSRVEPRLKTETPASFTTIRRNTALELQCVIVDVSSVGYGLLTQEPLNPGETIQVQIDGARVLTVVRHCGWREGGQHFIGVERVDEWLVAPKARAKTSQPRAKAAQTRVKTAHSRRTARIALAAGGALVIVLSGWHYGRAFLRPAGESLTMASAKAVPDTRLDPATQLAATRSIDSQSSADQSQTPIAVQRVAAADTSQQSVPVIPAVLQTPLEVNSKPEDVSPSQGLHRVSIRANDNSWVMGCSDGQKIFEKLFRPGDTAQFQFSGQALLHAGNGRALEISVDSRPVVVAGAGSFIRAWRFSPDGYKDVPAAGNRSCDIR